MQFNLLTIIFLLAALQSLIAGVAFALLNPDKAPRHPRLLASLFGLIAIALLDAGIERAGTYIDYPQFGNIGNVLAVALPGMLYIYARAIATEQFRLRITDLFHALPVTINGTVVLFSYHLQSSSFKSQYWIDGWNGHPLTSPWLTSIVLGLITIQVIMFIRLVLRHRRALLQVRSNTLDESYHFLKWFGIVYSGVLVLNALHSYLLQSGAISAMHIVGFLLGLWIYAMITILIIGLILRPQHQLALTEEEVAITGFEQSPETDVANAEEQESGYWQQLDQQLEGFMQAEKPFLDANLTLIQLARKLGVPARELSAFINKRIGCNFSDYIAGWRIDTFKQLFEQSGYNLSITEAMYEVGFNSKSAFNTHFKKRVGETPSEWRSRQQGVAA